MINAVGKAQNIPGGIFVTLAESLVNAVKGAINNMTAFGKGFFRIFAEAVFLSPEPGDSLVCSAPDFRAAGFLGLMGFIAISGSADDRADTLGNGIKGSAGTAFPEGFSRKIIVKTIKSAFHFNLLMFA